MSFDDTDWELEARRVMAAFGVTSPCKFDEADARRAERNLLEAL